MGHAPRARSAHGTNPHVCADAQTPVPVSSASSPCTSRKQLESWASRLLCLDASRARLSEERVSLVWRTLSLL